MRRKINRELGIKIAQALRDLRHGMRGAVATVKLARLAKATGEHHKRVEIVLRVLNALGLCTRDRSYCSFTKQQLDEAIRVLEQEWDKVLETRRRMSNRKRRSRKRMALISLRIPRKVLEVLDEISIANKKPRSALLREILIDFVKKSAAYEYEEEETEEDDEEDIPVIQGRL